MKSIYVVIIALVACTFSCRTKNGEAGLPGPAGAGVAGVPGENTLTKQGTISGILTFEDVNGQTQTFPYNYEYYESLEESKYFQGLSDTITVFEAKFNRRDLKDYDNYVDLVMSGKKMNNQIFINFKNFTFSNQQLVNNILYHFECYGYNDLIISNIKFDESTGRLTFEYENNNVKYEVNDKNATVKGNVDVILNRSLKNVVLFE